MNTNVFIKYQETFPGTYGDLSGPDTSWNIRKGFPYTVQCTVCPVTVYCTMYLSRKYSSSRGRNTFRADPSQNIFLFHVDFVHFLVMSFGCSNTEQ
jgi:hypothetical protein